MKSKEKKETFYKFPSPNLLNQVEEIANKNYGGHYTIYKFTTHYKGVFGTLMCGDTDIHTQLNALHPYRTMDELLYWMVENETQKKVI